MSRKSDLAQARKVFFSFDRRGRHLQAINNALDAAYYLGRAAQAEQDADWVHHLPCGCADKLRATAKRLRARVRKAAEGK